MARYKGPRVIDAITGKYHGRYAKKDKTKDERKQPLIRRIGKLKKLETYPYWLTKDNYKWVDTMNGNRQLWLVPTSNMYSFTDEQFSETIWAQLQEQNTEREKRLEEKLQDKQDKINKLKKEKRELQEEEEEKQKGQQQSSKTSRRKCDSCGETSTEKQWRENNDFCPECDSDVLGNAEKV